MGYISLDQARVLAMQVARESPGNYGRRLRNSLPECPITDGKGGDPFAASKVPANPIDL